MSKSTKPPLLFIHGFRGSPTGLAEITRAFPDYDVHTPFIPPSGKHPLAHYDLLHYIDFICQYIKTHHLKKPILIGHSMGSIIAAAVADQHPQLINHKLILLAPITKAVARPLTWLNPLFNICPSNLASYITNTFLFVPRQNRALYRKVLRLSTASANQYTSRHDVASAAKFASSHTLNEFKLTQKILIVSGEQDRIVPRTATEKFAHRTNAELHFIPQTGHILTYENPTAVANIIRDFLA